MNRTNSSSNSYIPWTLQTASKDDLIFIFACAPISILGVIFCASSVYILWSNEFKTSLFTYFRIECILMTVDLLITSIRSLAPIYMCRTTTKSNCPVPTGSLLPVVIDTYIFAYLPSPMEATALVTDIFAAIYCLIMIKPNRNRIEMFIFDVNPFLITAVVFILVALMFIYLCFTNVYLFHSNFVISNRIYFDLITFVEI